METYINGLIFTSDAVQPYAEAMIIDEGMIRWIGNMSSMPDNEGDIIDLGGKRVLPGFVDAHMHAAMLAKTLGQLACTPPGVKSNQELLDKITKTEWPSGWIRGWGYDEQKMAEKRMLTRWDLDLATGDIPAVITRSCLHVCIANSTALRLAGIDSKTAAPPGGRIDLDENGVPTGVLRESAMKLVTSLAPSPDRTESVRELLALSTELASYGITSVTEMMAGKGDFELFIAAKDAGFHQRCSLYYIWEELDTSILSDASTDTSSQIFIGGAKLFADGSITGRTAWVSPPYLGTDGQTGLRLSSREVMIQFCSFAKKAGIQAAIHAMGEKAIEMAVQVFSESGHWLGEEICQRIEHASLPSAEVLKMASARRIAMVPQPIFLFAEIEGYLFNLGIERTQKAYPIKTMLKKNIPVCISSDAPATAWSVPHDPFTGIQACVTRKTYNGEDAGQEERISTEEAIILYTRKAAEITRFSKTGQLSAGYRADFIILDSDILAAIPDELAETSVIKTYCGGRKIYDRYLPAT
ncbi:amidohydrolase [Peribacillus sp. SCS-37]|uniref:amidohydrolase n=1 Tax=Paraperibacillus esterisolvens TaxID=3115296 RepID=UPI0039067CC6